MKLTLNKSTWICFTSTLLWVRLGGKCSPTLTKGKRDVMCRTARSELMNHLLEYGVRDET